MNYLIIVIVCLLMFYRSLRYSIVVDDIGNRRKHLEDNKYLRKNIFQRIYNALNGVLPVKSILLDHSITLSIHTSVCCAIYCVFHNLPAALLFSVNVSNNQVSLWLNGKRYGINALLCLLAFSLGNYGIILWLITALFQVSAVSFPVIMALSGSLGYVLVIPFIFLLGNKHLMNWIKSKNDSCKIPEANTWNNKKVIFYFKTIAFYFIRGIFPYAPTMYPEKFKRFGLTDEITKDIYKFDFEAFVGVLIVVGILVGYTINSTLFFGLMWWLITISVFGNLITLTVPLAERYMYLPNIGLMLFIANLLSLLNPNTWMLLFLAYSTRMWTFMPMYKDMRSYLKHHCHYYPENDQAWIFRANTAAEYNDIFGVMSLANEGLIHSRNSVMLWLHRASGFTKIGKLDLAGQCLQNARNNATGLYGKIIDGKITEMEENHRRLLDGLQRKDIQRT